MKILNSESISIATTDIEKHTKIDRTY